MSICPSSPGTINAGLLSRCNMTGAFDPSILLQLNEWDNAKVQLLENVVTLMYNPSGSKSDKDIAHNVLNQLKQSTDSWRIVDTILAQSNDANTKFFALQILEDTITTRWRLFSVPERHGIRNYVVNVTIKLSSDDEMARTQSHFLTKLNQTLIQIVKQEWPDGWPSFITDICGAAKTNQSLCENNLRILSILSEDIFDFGKDSMVSQKVIKLKSSLTEQFASIFDLCLFIFKNHAGTPGSVKPSLLSTTLKTLSQFLSWIPLGYVFQTELVDVMLTHFWDPLQYRIECVQCLNEIASMTDGIQDFHAQFGALFNAVMLKVQQLPENAPQQLGTMSVNQRNFWETFLNQLALLLTGFMKQNIGAIKSQQQNVLYSLQYLARITEGSNEETFKVCLEFWQSFAAQLYVDIVQKQSQGGPPLLINVTGPTGTKEPIVPSTQLPILGGDDRMASSDTLNMYNPVLSNVRAILIDRMAKPPEVTIKENEEGHIVRQEEEDTDEIALYKSMREALIYLTNLNATDMQSLMCRQLSEFVQGNNLMWSATKLNRLCWAVGSISGGLCEIDEKKFLVQIVRDLLSLCENKKGKENKAVVASNIMYVVGQYPRFLKAHWKFLKTVIIKLMEFMHETFPGVQEMAVETFLKITHKCKKKFVIHQQGEVGPFVEQMINRIQQDISTLEPLHMCTFFETLGTMISAAPDEQKERLVGNLMSVMNQRWQKALEFANQDTQNIRDPKLLEEISINLRVNERVASAVGFGFAAQMNFIYVDMLRVYQVFSETISTQTAQADGSLSFGHIRAMRTVKRDILRLIQTFVDKSVTSLQESGAFSEHVFKQHRSDLAAKFLPPLLEPVLKDYKNNIPQARDAEVLDLFGVFANRLSTEISSELGRIFEMVFECTLEMIKLDFQSFPDHRVKLYDFLKAVNNNCFEALFYLPNNQLRLYVDSLIWAIKHEHIAVADMGLHIMHSFLQKIMRGPSSVYQPFFQTYYYSLMNDILSVLTDTLHKSGVRLQVNIIQQLIAASNTHQFEQNQPQKVMEQLYTLLSTYFKNISKHQAEQFIRGLFNKYLDNNEFLQHIYDFLISLKEWGGDDEIFLDRDAEIAREAAANQTRLMVPGLVPPHDPLRKDLEKDMDDI